MFFAKENIKQQDRLTKLYRTVERIFGSVPPQAKFLGDIDADYLEDYIAMVMRIIKQKNIHRDLFAFLRLHIAFREDYPYCKSYNTQILLKNVYKQKLLDRIVANIAEIPLDSNHKALAQFAVKTIYEPKKCTQQDFEYLYSIGWNQKEVFDAIEHAATLLKNGRIISAYMIKE